MRVIAGKWKGRRLKSVKGMQTRPTADKVKEAIFSILADKVRDARVLDLFAGTGNLSIEALSRGAAYAVLVEKSHCAGKTIQENLLILGANEQSRLIKMDSFTFLNQNLDEKYDLIFVDPPYHQEFVSKVISHLRHYPRLNSNGVIIVETAADEQIGEDLTPFEIVIAREYGDTKLWFLQEPEEQGEG